MSKTLTIVAEPNGAGKTTFSMELIDEGLIEHFINADEIAKSLPDVPDQVRNVRAGRIFLQRLNRAIEQELDICFETTLSGLSYLKLIKKLKAEGWQVTLYYLALENVGLSKQRVLERVLHGGHNIPEEDIERRFPKSIYNYFQHYLSKVDHSTLMINSESPEPVIHKVGSEILIYNEMKYQQFLEMANPNNV